MYNRKDSFYKKAKLEGYRSRASYKLLELNQKYKLFRKNDAVLDVGAAPGGWSQVALQLLGEKGIVVAVDILDINPLNDKRFHFIKGDIRDENTLSEITKYASSFDIVISDIAPNTTGQKFVDHQNSINLIKTVMNFIMKTLKKNGIFLFKLFDGEERESLVKDLKELFEDIKIIRPDATRKNSFEIYIICKGYKLG
ncbi:RlmE family RNA methyltransferase [Calditerrivibrio nitroreducens]|uniref:Ribosomal RNA large subunit methyltransferase E n=1 Tax=Calditerrivibrio nitroreducens (strain DSM 19672 / NBRC 101217 / Yu37-1) TaxID=768670 RepID=E4TJU0_CALNY|nr:RlmE family RNA methyltransferase [Calditerrivibrio nitroreducens]ADR19286.1 23S rRNA Um-2552 2'-O-methyltransferase [Calditerrivibrio nitroreducens DSM 19672]